MQNVLPRFEFVTFIAAICLMSGAIMGTYVKMFNVAPPLPVEFITLPIMGSMALVIALRLRESVFGVLSILPYFMLLLLALASYRWSLRPGTTIKDAMISILFVTYLGTMCWRYSWRELVEGMWRALFGMTILSFVLFFAVPSVGVNGAPHPGVMAGMWMEKNATGQVGAFGAIVALARLALNPRTVLSSMLSFLLFTLMLLMSTSKTSLVAYLIGCASFGWVFMMRRNMPVFIGTTWITLIGGGFLVNFIRQNTEFVLGLLGRSSTFTGRSEIWQSVKFSLADRPLLGHGYSGYWDQEVYGKTLAYVYDDLSYLPTHSHNSLIEMQLNLGLIGAGLLAISIVFYLLLALFRIRQNHGVYFVIPFTFAALIIGCFESVLAYPSNFAGAVIILVAGKMVRPALWSETRSTFTEFLNRTTAKNRARSQRQAARPVMRQPAERPLQTLSMPLPQLPPMPMAQGLPALPQMQTSQLGAIQARLRGRPLPTA